MDVVVFCVESPQDKPNDWVFIDATIKHFFEIGNRISVKPIFMGGKHNYRSRKVIARINEFKSCKPRKLSVIMCIDTDNYELNQQQAMELSEIKSYCEKKHYEFVWFCHDIEEVYLGKQINDKEKTKEAQRFGHKSLIEDVDKNCLCSEVYKKCSSNIYNVLLKVFAETHAEYVKGK